jgi:hypothetical protein
MVSKFDHETFPELPQPHGSNFYCVDDPASYRTLFSLYHTLIDIYGPKGLLIGHDEIRRLAACGLEKRAVSGLLADDVIHIHGWLAERGIRTLMWGDMLLDHDRWGATGAANSENPFWRSGETASAIEQLPRDVVILDWHYSDADDYPTVRYFHDHGFPVWGVGWYEAHAGVALARSVKRYGGEGMLGSDWGFWGTLSPAATSLYAAAAGWRTAIPVDGDGEDAVVALAEALREPVPTGPFEALPLDAVANETTWDEIFGDGRGLFDLGPALDLRRLPEGQHRFGGVDFVVGPAGAGAKQNVVVVAIPGTGGGLPAHVVIPLGGRNVQAVAFLHAAYVPAPRLRGGSLGRYRVSYDDDGPSQVVELEEGWNITDFRLARGLRLNPWRFFVGLDRLLGARRGWAGLAASGVPLTSDVIVWQNPTPDRGVRAVRFEATEKVPGCSLALLAMSVIAAEQGEGRAPQ